MTTTKCNPDRLTIERLAARTFVVLGGIFWVVATFSAERFYQGSSTLISARNALLPLALTLIVLAVGWFFEYAVSALLAIAAFAVVVWGLASGWEPGVWMLMISTLVAPMVISGTLFLLAARMQHVCTLEYVAAAKAAVEAEATG